MSSNGESSTTAASMRKIPQTLSPNYALKGTPESCSESINEEPCSQMRRNKSGGTKNLMKQSLERINKAIKRYGKKIGPEDSPGPFELSHNPECLSQARDYLDSEGSSLFGSIQIGPIQGNNGKQAFSENISNSIVGEGENQDIENFTLGPKQFQELKENMRLKKSSGKNLIDDFERADSKLDSRHKKRSLVKHASADRLHSHKRIFVNAEPNHLVMLSNNSTSQAPVILVDNKNSFMKRERGSAPSIEFKMNQNKDFQRGIVMDPNYRVA